MTVYLPKKWIDLKNLKPGNEIDILEVGEGLLFSAETILDKKEITIDLKSSEKKIIRTQLSDLYRLGYDKIKLVGVNKEQIEYVETSVEEFLLGVEITGKGTDYLILENVAEPSGKKQETLVRRMFLLIKETFELVKLDLAEGQVNNLKRVEKLTSKVGQYNNFCRRNISKKKFTEERINFHWGVYTYLILIQSSLKHLCKFLAKQKSLVISKESLKLFNKLESEFDLLYSSFFKKDLSGLEKVNNSCRKVLYGEVYSLLKKSKGEGTIVLYYFGELSRLIYLTTSPMLGILLE